jgi:exonuclease SbcC
MIPIKLTIKGINSYQSEQVIEFNNLVENKLFGIFGVVGSGKSTIPEAIAFALYKKTERLNKSDSVNYNLMNLKSNSMSIDFEFEAESKQKYRFRVTGKRNSKRFEEVDFKYQRYKWQNDNWYPDENLETETILGLSYENFKRTIIIPQNKFMEFIHLSDGDRSKMLKEIFNLGKYDLAGKVKTLEEKNNLEISDLTGQLKGLTEISKQAIDEKNQEKSIFSENKLKKEKQKSELETRFRELETIQGVFKELEITKKTNADLCLKKESIDKQEQILNNYKFCIYNFKNILEKKTEYSNKTDVIQKELKKITNDLLEKEIEIIDLNNSKNQLEKQFKNLDSMKTELKDIENIKQIKIKNQKFEELSSKKEVFNKQLTSYSEDIQKITQILIDEKSKIENFEQSLPDIALLTKIKEWYSKKAELLKNLKESDSQLKLKNNIIEDIQKRKNDIINSEHLKGLSLNVQKDLVSIKLQIDEKINSFDKALKYLFLEKEQHAVKQKLGEYSEALKEGKPCPVCGSTTHPEPIKMDFLDDKMKELQNRIEKGEQLIENLRISSNIISNLNIEFEKEKKNAEEIKEKILNLNKIIKLHYDTFVWKTYDPHNPQKAEEEISNIQINSDKIKKLRNEFENLEIKKSKLQNQKDEIQSELTKIDNMIFGYNSEIKLLNEQIIVLNPTDFLETEISVLNKIYHDKLLLIENTTSEYEIKTKKLQSAEVILAGLKSTINNLKSNLEESEKTIIAISAELDQKISNSAFSTETEIQEILALNLDIVKSENDISDFRMKFELSNSKLEDLKKQTQNIIFDETEFERLKKELKAVTDEITILTENIGALQKIVEEWSKKLQLKVALQKELEIKELRGEDLKLLKSLFMGNGFVNYISTIKLRELVNYANSRFIRLTRGNLSLELNANNSFDVIDHLNDGKRRNIKSLSGGQQFQASLSLALALAGIVQQQNKANQNFFFLDEGFGTQDEESLKLVFEAISSLKNENRIVGLISHVPELKENINLYLEVINDPNSGSLIQKSWEKA